MIIVIIQTIYEYISAMSIATKAEQSRTSSWKAGQYTMEHNEGAWHEISYMHKRNMIQYLAPIDSYIMSLHSRICSTVILTDGVWRAVRRPRWSAVIP